MINKPLLGEKIMDEIENNIPFKTNGSKLIMNDKEQEFKRIANECYQRLIHAALWVQDRHKQHSFFNPSDRGSYPGLHLDYPHNQMKTLHLIKEEVISASDDLYSYVKNIYCKIADYKKLHQSTSEKENIVNSLGRISQQKDFIKKTDDGIESLSHLIIKVRTGRRDGFLF